MYGEWYGVCDFVVFSVVDYGGLYVFHVCFDLYIVYCVGVCVNVCGQVGLGVGSWTSNLMNAASIPGEFDYNFVILLKNVE